VPFLIFPWALYELNSAPLPNQIQKSSHGFVPFLKSPPRLTFKVNRIFKELGL